MILELDKEMDSFVYETRRSTALNLKTVFSSRISLQIIRATRWSPRFSGEQFDWTGQGQHLEICRLFYDKTLMINFYRKISEHLLSRLIAETGSNESKNSSRNALPLINLFEHRPTLIWIYSNFPPLLSARAWIREILMRTLSTAAQKLSDKPVKLWSGLHCVIRCMGQMNGPDELAAQQGESHNRVPHRSIVPKRTVCVQEFAVIWIKN